MSNNQAKVEYYEMPYLVRPGEQFVTVLRLKNVGDTIWRSSQGYKLGSQLPQDNVTWGVGRVEMPVPEVNPGEECTFSFDCTSPSVEGYHGFGWQMLISGLGWFPNMFERRIKVEAEAELPALKEDPRSLVSARIFNTGSYPADNVKRKIKWRCPVSFRIKKTLIWTGLVYNGKADLKCSLIRESDDSILWPSEGDRYANPSGPDGKPIDYYDDYFELEEGDNLKLKYGGVAFDENGYPILEPPLNAHHTCHIWVVRIP